ncbi:TonB-dependent receptor plug domain-containing protein [Sediminicola sp. 1XM1-17]|uniref:TonB-dependent receptor plug domain-containing protein n=1 Tax=Sediminicola sp. 1XM1-17 TaxID=3127702 RepID=UPI003077EC31
MGFKRFLCCFWLLVICGTVHAQNEKYVMVGWDASLSMANRSIENDLKFLENYFKVNQEAKVNLVIFSNAVIENQEIQISNGNWTALKEKLNKVIYDGATNYGALEQVISLHHTDLLLFTDGNQNMAGTVPNFGVKTFIINSSPNKDQFGLNKLLVANKARIFDYGVLEAKEDVTGSPKASNSEPAKANEPRSLGINLEEVVVTENTRNNKEDRTVRTASGEIDEDRVGVAVQSIGEEDITPIQTNVSQSVQNKFSGVEVKQNQDISQVKMRTDNSMLLNNYGLIVIDGVPQQQSNSNGSSPLANFGFLNPDNIADITVLKGMAATTKYGTLGANGVILITTKSSKAPVVKGQKQDMARLKNNVYVEDIDQIETTYTAVLKSLQKSSSPNEAYETYIALRNFNGSSVQFYMDAFNYFKASEPEIAVRALSNMVELFPNDIPKLKSAALALSSIGAYKEVVQINERILVLDPKMVQSNLDIALALADQGKSQQALDQLLALAKRNVSFNNEQLSKTLDREIRNILFLHQDKLNTTKVDPKYFQNLKYNVRLVFEWNTPKADFELQFVNPDNRFFDWDHSYASKSERIQDEIEHGYTSEEFEFYGDVSGKWIFNATYLGSNGDSTPEIFTLKCSIYENFGTPEQSKKEVMVNFTEPLQKLNVATIIVE